MPLQIRRGTELQRLSLTPSTGLVVGELLFVTDTQKLYIGNGSTPGGVVATTYTDDDAKAAAANSITSGTHQYISFTYNSVTKTLSSTLDLSDYQGSLRASSFKGSVLADDGSSITGVTLVDATNGSINLNGTVKGNIVPDLNITYDIGTNLLRFKDLYLSGSSIYLGNAILSANGTAIDLPLGSTIGGEPISGGSTSDSKGNVVADDSTIMVNTATKTITAGGGFLGNVTGDIVGNTTGFHFGDVKGSVFGDDSTEIVRGDTSSLNANFITIGTHLTITGTSDFPGLGPKITNTNPGNNAIIFDNASIDIYSDFGVIQSGVSVTGVTNGILTTSQIAFSGSRGTATAPTTLNNGDAFSGVLFNGHNGTDYVPAVLFAAQCTGVPNPAAPSIPGKFIITVADGTNNVFAVNKQATFDSAGTFSVPIMQVGSYDNAGEGGITAAIGMIIYNTTTNKFRGYSNAGWVDLS